MRKTKHAPEAILKDWAGNELFCGPVDAPELEEIISKNELGDLVLAWVDERDDNVWEWI